MQFFTSRITPLICSITLLFAGLTLAGCGGGSGSPAVSSQVVTGTAAVGLPLSGQVTLQDASSPSQQKTTVIGSDGSFSLDVTGMKAPFILQASGSANNQNHTLFSFANGAGIANINPLSDALLTIASGNINPGNVFAAPDSQKLKTIQDSLPAATQDLLTMLNPLLDLYGAAGKDPITSPYRADHSGIDGMLDAVTISTANGTLTVVNRGTSATIFSCAMNNVSSGTFTPGNMPHQPTAPAAPTGLSAVGGSGQITVSWSTVSNAASYNLYYASTSGVTPDNGTKLANVTSPTVLTGLADATTYYCIVTAVNSAGESIASTQVSAVTNAAAPVLPTAPAGTIATGGTKQVSISWNAVSNATSYNLYWSTAAGVTTSTGTKVSGVTSPAVLSNLADGTTYYCVVTAVNSAGESAASVQVAATTLPATPPPTVPSAPASLTAVGGANQVTLSWPAANNATSYNLYWSTTAGVTTATGTKVSGVTSPYVKTGLAAGTPYYFIVTALNNVGESSASPQATATTNAPLPTVPAAPTGVSATGGTNQVSLSWSAETGATSYTVYWSTASGVTTANGTKIANVTSPYLHTGLAAGTTYYYIVTAVNSAGESSASAQASALTTATALDGAALYAQYCNSCHGSSKRGKTAAAIQSAIDKNRGGMGFLNFLTPDQIAAIAAW